MLLNLCGFLSYKYLLLAPTPLSPDGVEEGGDLEREAARQREYLEKTVDSLKRKLAKDSELHRTDNLRIMQVGVWVLCTRAHSLTLATSLYRSLLASSCLNERSIARAVGCWPDVTCDLTQHILKLGVYPSTVLGVHGCGLTPPFISAIPPALDSRLPPSRKTRLSSRRSTSCGGRSGHYVPVQQVRARFCLRVPAYMLLQCADRRCLSVQIGSKPPAG
jgi:hypothetical protein